MVPTLDPASIFYTLIYLVSVLVICLTFHEAAHAWTALQLGDDTPQKMGRVSLNPLAHLDPVGSMLMLFSLIVFRVGLGWGKPVQIDATKLKPNPKVGMAIVAMAGPLSNLLLATFGALLLRTHLLTFNPQKFFTIGGQNYYFAPGVFVETFVLVNLTLMLFNLIPLAPLDGSRLWQIFLPDKIYWRYARYEIFAAFLVIGLVLADIAFGFGILSRVLTSPVCGMWRVAVGFGTPDMCLQLR
jgi:Zn-dependent protease